MLGAAIKVIVLLLVAACFIGVAYYALNALYRAYTGEVQIAKIPDLAHNEIDRAPYLLARAEELAKPVSLDALYEVRVPLLATRFGMKDNLNFLDEVTINIQGVNVPGTIKSLFAALPDFQTVVSTAPQPISSGSAAQLEWKTFSGRKKTWLLRSDKPPTEAKATLEIIDQAIYQMIYYLRYDPNGPGPPPKGVRFPSERALQAYYSGQQHLSAYQRRRESSPAGQKESQEELNEAEKQFRILYQEMRDFTDGLMLLGLTLLEQKNEREAIAIFERIKDTLKRNAGPAPENQEEKERPDANAANQQQPSDEEALEKMTPEQKKEFFSAKLFQAIARRKLYKIEDNHRALAAIEWIIAHVEQLHNAYRAEKTRENVDWMDFMKIHISALAEKAYVLGAYLVLLNPENFAAKLDAAHPKPGEQLPPDSVALKQENLERILKADPKDVKTVRLEEFRKKMKDIYTVHGTAVAEAQNLITELEGAENEPDKKSIHERFRSDLNDAAGFAQFRRAQAVLEPEIGGKDTAFLDECKGALHSLREAYAENQNEETILLNFGLIESDPRWDPNGENIETARKYLEQAAAMKPTDYYAQELLARLGIRELYTWGALTKPEILPATITAAENARALRPEDGTILALLAQAYILQWAQAGNQDRTKIQPKIEMAITQAKKRNATLVHLDTVQLQWLVVQAANSSNDDFNKEDYKGRLATAIGTALGDADDSWYGRKLKHDAEELGQMLKDLKPGKQSGLHWPN